MDDGIAGANGHYVIDGYPTPTRDNPEGIGVTLEGGALRNILLGTPDNDTLIGGPDHDGLIGRGGADEFFGNSGNDNIVPWVTPSAETTTVTVDGGDGFDRVYLKDIEDNYDLDCSVNTCELEANSGGKLILTNVEMLMFKASTRRLVE